MHDLGHLESRILSSLYLKLAALVPVHCPVSSCRVSQPRLMFVIEPIIN